MSGSVFCILSTRALAYLVTPCRSGITFWHPNLPGRLWSGGYVHVRGSTFFIYIACIFTVVVNIWIFVTKLIINCFIYTRKNVITSEWSRMFFNLILLLYRKENHWFIFLVVLLIFVVFLVFCCATVTSLRRTTQLY